MSLVGMAEKNEIRRMMRMRRRALSADERARAAAVICDRVANLPAGAVCAVYLSSPDEIDLTGAIEKFLDRGVVVVAPRWNGKMYELAKLKSLSEGDLRAGPMGIREPKDADIVPPGTVEVWFVPGLAFTEDGRRLGYGGGWYDRLMAEAKGGARKIGIAYGFQVVEDLPSEPHDIRLTSVICDSSRSALS